MCPCFRGCHASAVGAHEETLAHQVRFRDSLDGFRFLTDGDGQSCQAHGSAGEATAHSLENRSVQAVQAGGVHLEELEGSARGVQGERSVTMDLRVVDDAAQQAIGDAWRASRTRGDLVGGARVDGRAEQGGRARDDRLEFVGLVELQVRGEAEAVAQRGGQQAGARGRTHDRERRQRQGDGGRAGALTDDDVDAEVLHREIEHLLGGAREAVNLVDEEDVAFLQARQDRGQVPRVLDRGTRGQAQGGSHLCGDNHGEGRLAQARRAGEQDVVGCGGAHAGGVEDQL